MFQNNLILQDQFQFFQIQILVYFDIYIQIIMPKYSSNIPASPGYNFSTVRFVSFYKCPIKKRGMFHLIIYNQMCQISFSSRSLGTL